MKRVHKIKTMNNTKECDNLLPDEKVCLVVAGVAGDVGAGVAGIG